MIKKLNKKIVLCSLIILSVFFVLLGLTTQTVNATDIGNWTWSSGSLTNQTGSVLPDATVGEAYHVEFVVEGYSELYVYDIVFSSTGTHQDPGFENGYPTWDVISIDGTPQYAGTYTVVITDTMGEYSKTFTLTVKPTGYSIYYVSNGGTTVETATGQKKLPAILPVTSKKGYVFMGWYTDATLDTEANAGSEITQDTTLYAKWKPIIKTQPSKDNFYTVELDNATSSISYQWYMIDYEDIKGFISTDLNSNSVYGSIDEVSITSTSTTLIEGANSVVTIKINNDAVELEGFAIKFDSSEELQGYLFKNDSTYIYDIESNSTEYCINVTSEATAFVLNNISFVKNDVAIAGETSNQIGYDSNNKSTNLVIKDAVYYCKVFLNSTEIAQSDYIIPTRIGFNAGDGNGSMDEIFQFAGRIITLPVCTFTYTDDTKIFAGWSYDSNLYNEKTIFTAPDSNIKLIATWGHYCNGITFINELDFTFTGGTLQSGTYYLTSDITLLELMQVLANKEVTICLNGHVINLNNHIINALGDLYIYDCMNDEDHKHYYKAVTGEKYYELCEEEDDPLGYVTGGVITGYRNIISTDGSGAILSRSDLWLENINFIGNQGQLGGAIYNESGLASIIDCNFIGNESKKGGAICGPTNYSGELKVYDCLFEYNSSEEGGAIYSNDDVLLFNCTIQNNTANNGGGIFALNNTRVVMVNTSVTNNTATVNGGGVFVKDGGCFLAGTEITMADGSKKSIEKIKVGDYVKSFNHETGEYVSSKVYYVYSKIDGSSYFTLNFEDGTSLSIVDRHDLFSMNENKYVTITKDNVDSYFESGDKFYNATTGEFVEIDSVTINNNSSSYYTIYVSNTVNCIANDMLTAPDDCDFQLNVYEFGTDLVADATQLASDLTLYGVYPYSECVDIITETEYDCFNLKYLYIAEGKGLTTLSKVKSLFYFWHDVDHYAEGISTTGIVLGKNTIVKNNTVNDKPNNISINNTSKIYVVDNATGIEAGVNIFDPTYNFAEKVYTTDETKVKFTSDYEGVCIVKTKTTDNRYNYSFDIIKDDPSQENDFEVIVAEEYENDVTYQWYKEVNYDSLYQIKDDYYDLLNNTTIDGNVISAGNNGSGVYYLTFYLSESFETYFTFEYSGTKEFSLYDESTSSIISKDGDCYVVYVSDGKLFLQSSDEFDITISSISVRVALDGETDSKIGSTTLEDTIYYCNVYYKGTLVSVSESITPVKVSFIGGTGVTGTSPSVVYQFAGREITLPENTFSKSGYNFDKWSNESKTYKVGDNYSVGASYTVFEPTWNAINYNITYNLNGGLNDIDNPSTYTVETATITLADPSKIGCAFAGWYDNAEFTGSPITIIALGSTGDKVLYAKWYHVCHDIIFDKELDSNFTGDNLLTGNYVLTSDITLDVRVYINAGATVNICLNGYTITFKHGINVAADATQGVNNTSLSFYDCNESKGKLYYGEIYDNYLVFTKSATITFNEINIEAGKKTVVKVAESTDTGKVIFNKCTIDLFGSLIYTNGNVKNWTFDVIGKEKTNAEDYDIKRVYSTLNKYPYPIINVDSIVNNESVVNLNNVKLINYSGEVFDGCYVTFNIDENSVIKLGLLRKAIEIEDGDLHIKGEISLIDGYVPSEEELEKDMRNKSLIFNTFNGVVHLYSTTKLSNYQGCAHIFTDNNYSSEQLTCIVIEEELENTTPYIVYSGREAINDYKLAEKELIYGFFAYNENKEVEDYFDIVYSTEDDNPFFFEADETNDVIILKKFVFTKQPTEEDREVETNHDDVTYEWYKAEECINKRILIEDLDGIPSYIIVDDNGYMTYHYDNEEDMAIYATYKTEMPKFNRIGAYIVAKEGGYTIPDLTEASFQYETVGLTGYKVKLFITLEGEETPIEVTNLNASGYGNEYVALCTYENGYWVAGKNEIEENGISNYYTYIHFDTTSGSPFENLGTYSLTMVFEKDFPAFELNSSYVSMMEDYLFCDQGFEGALVYFTYDSLIINEKVDSETTETLVDPKAGQYVCGATFDGMTIYSKVLTIKPIDVEIDEETYEYTYSGEGKSFEVDSDIEDNFTVYYAESKENHTESDWSTVEPINAGSYDVLITREADDYYAEFSKEISNGLVINKFALELVLSNESDINVTYGDTITEATATTNYPDYNSYVEFTIQYVKVIDKDTKNYEVVTEIKNAGNYAIIYTATSKSDNFDIDETITIYVNVSKMKVNEPTINGTYTYNGKSQNIMLSGVETYMSTEDSLTQTNAGTYTITFTLDDNYDWNTNNDGIITWVIDKMEVAEPSIIGAYIYTGEEQTVGMICEESYMTTESSFTQTNAGTYDIVYTLDDNHKWNEFSDGVVKWVIQKAPNSITVDTTDIVKTYGETIELPEASSLIGTVTNDATELVNAGTYIVTYSVVGNDNYDGASVSINVIINKMKVNEPIVIGSYVYNGQAQTVNLSGKESYMNTTDVLTQTEVGVYTINFTLDGNHEWATYDGGVVTWEIKAASITPKKDDPQEEKIEVIVETENGFSEDITVVVEVTVEVEIESKVLTVDYYDITDETAKLNENEKVGIIFDVKLIQTINGIEKEIQPSDIAPGTKIKVKMLIPENVDISKITRILHVHSADNIETIEFDASKVDENRYYEIEVSELSEFAFIYENENNCNIHWFLIALLVALLGFVAVLWFGFKIRDFKNKKGKVNIAPIIGFALHLIGTIVLEVLSGCGVCIVFYIINLLALALAIVLYGINKEKKENNKQSKVKVKENSKEQPKETNDETKEESSEQSVEEQKETTTEESKDNLDK